MSLNFSGYPQQRTVAGAQPINSFGGAQPMTSFGGAYRTPTTISAGAVRSAYPSYNPTPLAGSAPPPRTMNVNGQLISAGTGLRTSTTGYPQSFSGMSGGRVVQGGTIGASAYSGGSLVGGYPTRIGGSMVAPVGGSMVGGSMVGGSYIQRPSGASQNLGGSIRTVAASGIQTGSIRRQVVLNNRGVVARASLEKTEEQEAPDPAMDAAEFQKAVTAPEAIPARRMSLNREIKEQSSPVERKDLLRDIKRSGTLRDEVPDERKKLNEEIARSPKALKEHVPAQQASLLSEIARSPKALQERNPAQQASLLSELGDRFGGDFFDDEPAKAASPPKTSTSPPKKAASPAKSNINVNEKVVVAASHPKYGGCSGMVSSVEGGNVSVMMMVDGKREFVTLSADVVSKATKAVSPEKPAPAPAPAAAPAVAAPAPAAAAAAASPATEGGKPKNKNKNKNKGKGKGKGGGKGK